MQRLLIPLVAIVATSPIAIDQTAAAKPAPPEITAQGLTDRMLSLVDEAEELAGSARVQRLGFVDKDAQSWQARADALAVDADTWIVTIDQVSDCQDAIWVAAISVQTSGRNLILSSAGITGGTAKATATLSKIREVAMAGDICEEQPAAHVGLFPY